MEHNGSMPSKDLYDDLPQKIKLYLKTAKGLKGFVGFYPALFDEKNELDSSSDDQIIELTTVPIFKTEKDLKLPHGSDPKKGWCFCYNFLNLLEKIISYLDSLMYKPLVKKLWVAKKY